MNHYDNPEFFASYAQMSRSQQGLSGAGEWHQLQLLFPGLVGKDVLDLGCGIEHPTFTSGVNQQFAQDGTWPVDNYYYPGERTTDFLGHKITKYHHTLSQIIGGLLKAGFRIVAVEEATPPEEWRAFMPDEMRRPMMLLVKAIKE